jgi:predicted DNA-binding protein
MSEDLQKTPSGKLSLTLLLPASLAERLEAVARAQNRSPASYVVDLLERTLPRLPSAGQQQRKIPYA